MGSTLCSSCLWHEYALDFVLCMPSQHHASGLQTDCMVVVPAPMVRLPDPTCMPYGPRLQLATHGIKPVKLTIKGLSISHAIEELCYHPKRQQHLRLAQHACITRLCMKSL